MMSFSHTSSLLKHLTYRNQFYWIVGIMFCCAATATLVVKPRNTTSSQGHRVQLDCATSDLTTPVNWQYIPVGDGEVLSHPKDVFIKDMLVTGYGQRFEIHRNRTTGSYDLVIRSVQFSDAGTYRCRDMDGRGEHVDATLNITGNTDLRISPEYAEAQVGKIVQLNCTTYHKTESVNWQHIPLGKSLPDDVYISGKFYNKYTSGYDAQMDTETGINSLIITAVKIRDGGIYRCIEKQGRGQNRDAELTVIDKVTCQMFTDDSCGTSPENVTLECSMTFFGKFAPVVQWVTTEGDVINEGVTVTNHSDSVTSTLVKEVDNPSLPLDYTCQAKTSTTSCKPINSAQCTTEVFDSSTHSDEPKAEQSSTGNNLNYLAFLGLLIIIPIAIGIYCANKKCRRKSDKPEEPVDKHELENMLSPNQENT